MKSQVLSVIVFATLGIASTVNAAGEFREFKSTKGDALKAYIKEFDAKRQMVTLKLEAGVTKKLPVAAFSESDQAYIRDWPNVDAFMSNEKLRIYLDEPKQISKWIKETWGLAMGKEQKKHILTRDFKRMVYPVRMVNQSGVNMTNVIVKCCVYSKHERIDHAVEEEVVDLQVRPKVFTIDMLKAKANTKFDTQSTVLIQKEIYQGTGNKRRLQYLQGACRRQDAWMEGMILRLFWKTPGGQELMREVRYPRDLSVEEYKWVEPTGDEVEEEYDETNSLGPGKKEYYDDEMSDDNDDGF